MRIATGVASDDNEGQGWTLVTRNRNRRHAGSTQEVAKKDGCIDLGAVIPCDLYSNILGFASHVDICVISEVSIAMKGAGREEQHRRDEGSGERLHDFLLTFRRASPPPFVELQDKFVDPRTWDQHWEAMPLHAQLLAFEGYVRAVRGGVIAALRCENELPEPSLRGMTFLKSTTCFFTGMLSDKTANEHLADCGPLSEEVMFRVLACHLWDRFEQRGSGDIDIGNLLAGKKSSLTMTLQSRNEIFRVLLSSLGYNELLGVYSGIAGRCGSAYLAFDANLEDDSAKTARKAQNVAYQQGLFDEHQSDAQLQLGNSRCSCNDIFCARQFVRKLQVHL
jgi:hypothetical protein